MRSLLVLMAAGTLFTFGAPMVSPSGRTERALCGDGRTTSPPFDAGRQASPDSLIFTVRAATDHAVVGFLLVKRDQAALPSGGAQAAADTLRGMSPARFRLPRTVFHLQVVSGDVTQPLCVWLSDRPGLPPIKAWGRRVTLVTTLKPVGPRASVELLEPS
jgi:hypothetical protein